VAFTRRDITGHQRRHMDRLLAAFVAALVILALWTFEPVMTE
jgi:hypothetical protein